MLNMIKDWQTAINIEIAQLKKYGHTKYRITNGQLIKSGEIFTYYFQTTATVNIPVKTFITLCIDEVEEKAQLLSSEGIGLVIESPRSFGEFIHEGYISHDPWELLEELNVRLDEIKKSKRKRSRVNRLMNPSVNLRHPIEQIKGNVHELVLRSKYNPITFVWGPPGTGKTYTLARVAANKYIKNKKVLILSQSNQAVDVLINEVALFLLKKDKFLEGHVIRYGTNMSGVLLKEVTIDHLLHKSHPSIIVEKTKLSEERKLLKQDLTTSFSQRDTHDLLTIEEKLTKLTEKIRRKEEHLIKDAKVIATTLAKAATDPLIYEQTFDLVIVDEASMAYVPQIAFASSLGKRMIVCGDFKQLPPIAATRHPLVEKWLKEDVFHRCGVVGEKLHPQLFLLREQRRMHPAISAFTNKYIYESRVVDHPCTTQRVELSMKKPFQHHASILLSSIGSGSYCLTDNSSGSRINIWNLLLSFQVIQEAYVNGFRSIGYVTPYRAQASLMNGLLKEIFLEQSIEANIVAATVHRFQGSERDVMVFDSVDSYPQGRAGYLLTGPNSERLLNVAMTRTRGKFVHVCDQNFFKARTKRGKKINQLIEHQQTFDRVVNHQEIGHWIKHHHDHIQWKHALNKEAVIKDLTKVKKQIVIGYEGEALSREWTNILTKYQDKLTIYFKSEIKNLKPTQLFEEIAPFSFINIDNKILWIGQPFDKTKCIEPPFVAIRIEAPSFIQQFMGMLGCSF
ncbi:DEAD/DEAH box helicase [Bacillus carboniphilus]